jgi:hypothetical protein
MVGGDSVEGGGGKRLGGLEIAALIGHDAMNTLKDAKLIRGQRNDEFWRDFKLGLNPRLPGTPLVNKKFYDYLRGAGVTIQDQPGGAKKLMAMAGKDVATLTQGRELKSDRTFNPKSFEPERGGLFDPHLFGPDGSQWAHIKLDEPVPNPVMEDSLSRILKMTKKDYNAVVEGRKDLDGKTGGEALKAKLGQVDLAAEIKAEIENVRNNSGSKRDEAVKRLRALEGVKRQGHVPSDYMLDAIPVLPPRFRPITQAGDVNIASDVNYLYKVMALS